MELQVSQSGANAQIPDRTKIMLLRNYLGAEGQKRFGTQPVNDILQTPNPTYAEVQTAAIDTFADKVNEIRAMHDFFQARQSSGESIGEFICTLRQKIVNCGIPLDQQKRLLAVVFSIGISSPHRRSS